MFDRPLDFWDSWSITLNLTVLDRGLAVTNAANTHLH